jgi:hypothetical protein
MFAALSRVATGIVTRSKTIGSRNMSITYKQIDKTGKKYEIWKDKFKFHAEKLLTEQGCALCHEMAKYSMPVRANSQFSSDTARSMLAKENADLANIAFKPVSLKSPAWWILAGYVDIAQYVMQTTGWKFNNETMNRWYKNGQYEILRGALVNWGGYKQPRGDQIPSSSRMLDEAEYSKFVRWKSVYKKEGAAKHYWVKKEASIKKVAQEKSLYNYASICINGWLKASAKLGDKLPSGVSKVSWPYAKNLGSGNMKINKLSDTHFRLTYYNRHGNLAGIFDGQVQQAIYKRRNDIAQQEISKLLKTMLKYWEKIQV